MEEEITLSPEENNIVKMLLGIRNSCSSTSDIRQWTVDMSGDSNPFKNGNYCFRFKFTSAFSARRIIKVLVRDHNMASDHKLEDKTDDNISIQCIFLEHNRYVGTN
jgi:hypothetical protein